MRSKLIPALTSVLLIASALSACADTENKDNTGVSGTSASSESAENKTGKNDENKDSEEAEESIPEEPSGPVINGVKLAFGTPSGFYDEDISLEIFCEDENAVVYYTTDGNTPTEKSEKYTKPIKLGNRTRDENILCTVRGLSASGDFVPKGKIDKTNVIRAAAFLPDGSRSEVINGTFFVGIDRAAKYGNAPVISIITDTVNLFNYETGIFVLGKTHDDWIAEDPKNAKLEGWQQVGNYSNRGREWERPASVEYFAPDGSVGFAQNMGMRVMGAASRNEQQKSLRLTARAEYGEKNVKYEVIPDNMRSDKSGNVEKYKSFVLRNGGNDCNFAKVRDPFLQSLVYDRRFDTEQFTPCVVFIDGEYWGMYTLGEDYSDNYIENNYGIKNKNVIVVKRGEIEDGEDEDIELFNEMYDFITENDMTNAGNYAKAEEMFDMGSFADYCAFNLYIYNEDSIFKDNNWEMWRVREPDGSSAFADGKWRMLVYDTDYSTGIYNEGKNYSKNNISEVLRNEEYEHRHPAVLFRSLYKNDDFRREFVLALCDIRNINFEKYAASEKLSKIASVYSGLVADTFKRFGPDWVAWQDTEQYFMMRIGELSTFIDGRYSTFPKTMQKALSLGESAELSLSVSDDEKGSVMINSSGAEINSGFSGIYFTGFDITLTAVPKNGAKFVRWECENCTVSNAESDNTSVSFNGDFSVKAIFE